MTKKAKIGRPRLPKTEKKRHIVAFKLDDSELAALKRKARELGLSKSEAIREAIVRLVSD